MNKPVFILCEGQSEEALLFSDVLAFGAIYGQEIQTEVQDTVSQFASPEHINDNPNTAPSKRLEKLIPRYKKAVDGMVLAETIGLDAMLAKCQHFSVWINDLLKITLN